MTNSNKQIKLGALLSYFAIAFNIVSGLIYTPWMVRQIGQSDYGLYTLVTSLITYFTLDFGFGSSISKFVAQYRAEKRENEIGSLLGLIYKFYFVLDILIFIVLVIVFCFIQNVFISLTAEELEKCRVIFVIFGAFTLISFPCTTFNGILIAYEKFIALKVCDLLSKLLTVFLMVIFLFMGYRLYALVIINTGVQLFINVIKYIIVRKNVRQKIDFKYFSMRLLKTIFSFSIWVTVISVAERFIMNITPSILGITSGSTDISIFAVGRTIEGYVYTFASALSSLFIPMLSKMVAENASREKIMDLMIRVGRIILMIVGVIVTVFISMGREFVILWMGAIFDSAYSVAVFLILTSIITFSLNIGAVLIMVENKVKYTAICYSITAVINIGLSFALSWRYGALGAAISICIATIAGHIIGMNWVYQNKMGLNMKRFYVDCHFRAIPIFILVAISGFTIQYFWKADNLLVFGIKAAIIGFEYLILMWFLYMNRSEKDLILQPIRKILKRG